MPLHGRRGFGHRIKNRIGSVAFSEWHGKFERMLTKQEVEDRLSDHHETLVSIVK